MLPLNPTSPNPAFEKFPPSHRQDALGRPVGREPSLERGLHAHTWGQGGCKPAGPTDPPPGPSLPSLCHCSPPVSPECEGSWGSSHGGLPAGVAVGERGHARSWRRWRQEELGSQPRELRSRQVRAAPAHEAQGRSRAASGPRAGQAEAGRPERPQLGRAAAGGGPRAGAELCRLSPGCQLRAPPHPP